MKWNEAKSGRLIRKAADIMNDKGHTTGSLSNVEGELCVRGAVNYAWSGNARITDNYEYDTVMMNIGFDTVFVKPVRNLAPLQRNPEVIHTLTHFRNFLHKNNMLGGYGTGVEFFNDHNSKDEVIRWMHKYADEVDPKRP